MCVREGERCVYNGRLILLALNGNFGLPLF